MTDAAAPGPAEDNLGSFREIALAPFDPAAVARVLMTTDRTRYYERFVLFAGFSTWVIAPDDTNAIRDAMVLKTQETQRYLVKSYRAKFRKDHDKACSRNTAETAIRKKYKEFFRNVVTPLEGKVIHTQSVADLKQTLADRRRHVERTLKLMGTFHYIANVLVPKGGYLSPSLVRGKTIVGRLSPSTTETAPQLKGETGHGVHQSWTKQRQSAHLLYAASSINLAGDITLVEHLLSRGAYKRDIDFKSWFGRANHIAQNVLQNTLDRTGRLEPYDIVPRVQGANFEPPAFNDADRVLIETTYKKKNAGP